MKVKLHLCTMKNILLYTCISLLFGACASSVSKEDVQTAIAGHSYLLTDAKQQAVPIAFVSDCVINYKLDNTLLFDKWEVKEADGQVVLACGQQDFVPKRSESGDLQFVDAKTGEQLTKVKDALFAADQLVGEWKDSYAAMVKGVPGKGPKAPCPNLPAGSFLEPLVIFTKDSCILQDYCTRTSYPYSFNTLHGCIQLGELCDTKEIWKIKQLTAKEIVVDISTVMEDGRLGSEVGKRYFKP